MEACVSCIYRQNSVAGCYFVYIWAFNGKVNNEINMNFQLETMQSDDYQNGSAAFISYIITNVDQKLQCWNHDQVTYYHHAFRVVHSGPFCQFDFILSERNKNVATRRGIRINSYENSNFEQKKKVWRIPFYLTNVKSKSALMAEISSNSGTGDDLIFYLWTNAQCVSWWMPYRFTCIGRPSNILWSALEMRHTKNHIFHCTCKL